MYLLGFKSHEMIFWKTAHVLAVQKKKSCFFCKYVFNYNKPSSNEKEESVNNIGSDIGYLANKIESEKETKLPEI